MFSAVKTCLLAELHERREGRAAAIPASPAAHLLRGGAGRTSRAVSRAVDGEAVL